VGGRGKHQEGRERRNILTIEHTPEKGEGRRKDTTGDTVSIGKEHHEKKPKHSTPNHNKLVLPPQALYQELRGSLKQRIPTLRGKRKFRRETE